MATIPRDLPRLAHPLEPLSADEIAQAVRLVRQRPELSQRLRFFNVSLHEPPKERVLAPAPGETLEREAFVAVLDNASGQTYEAVVSLSRGEITSWKHLPGVQPPMLVEEFIDCGEAVKANPEWQEAMRKRGITDFSLVMIEPWSAGEYGLADDPKGVRLTRALTWVRRHPTDNGYARPVDGVIAFVDLNTLQVLRVDDYGVVPLPPEDGNYLPETVGPLRTDLKPLEIHQPEGPSFQLEGHELRWQKWRLRIGFTPREGLVLYTVSYNDQGQERPILYRASICDMVVPYGDPRPMYFFRNAFDIGEFGIGLMANSLELGCDCLGEIRYLDAVVPRASGDPLTIKNAICIHEEDYGILWKHYDWRLNHAEVRRSRRLVISFIATVGNYEYGFYWYFYQDGTIQLEVKLTGVVSNGAEPLGASPPWGSMIAPGLYAPIHQHFFNARLDMMVDGLNNSVYEVNTVADPPGPDNPHRNAFRAVSTLLARESEAQRVIDPFSARYWKVVNPNKTNRLGQPVAYKLVPGENVLPFAAPDASVIQRAGFMTKHLWVTRYDPAEKSAAGDYPNQHPGGAGLPKYVQADRELENTDVVLWYTFGPHHVVRTEDWPVMPVSTIGFTLKPLNFFDRNPALDVPPPRRHCTPGRADGDGCH